MDTLVTLGVGMVVGAVVALGACLLTVMGR
jgi:hypothetical protein